MCFIDVHIYGFCCCCCCCCSRCNCSLVVQIIRSQNKKFCFQFCYLPGLSQNLLVPSLSIASVVQIILQPPYFPFHRFVIFNFPWIYCCCPVVFVLHLFPFHYVLSLTKRKFQLSDREYKALYFKSNHNTAEIYVLSNCFRSFEIKLCGMISYFW